MTAVNVAFAGTWLTLLSDPTHPIHAEKTDRKISVVRAGQNFDTIAGGIVTVTSPSTARTYPITLMALSEADFERLVTWQAQMCLLRDGSGTRRFGTFLDASSDSRELLGYDVTHNVTITFTVKPYREGV